MFFEASKIFWGLCAPSHLLLWCALTAAILLLTGRRRTGTGFAVATALLLVSMGVVPSYNWLGRSLESRFENQRLPTHADGIMVLGGGIEDIHRLPVAFMLSRRYPAAKVVYSGGSGALIDNRPDVDAQRAKTFLTALGLDPARLVLEGRSRNTYENFVFTKALVKPQPGDTWILVTSAYHMPRAMQIANRVNWRMAPCSSDRLSARHGLIGWFNIPNNLNRFDMLLREWIGMHVYQISGKAS